MVEQVLRERDLDRLWADATAYAVIVAWSRSGALDRLAAGEPCDAAALGLDVRAVDLTAPVLVRLGLLARAGKGWVLTRSARELHARGVLGRAWGGRDLAELSELERVLVDGVPIAATRGGVRPDDPERTRAFLTMLARRSTDSADELARMLAPRLPAGARVADVGGGHGRYALSLAERGLDVTLLDLAPALAVARELCGERLRYREADFLVDDLGGPYDAAVVSNIVHNLGVDENRRLLARLRDVLAPGGVIAIKDLLLDDLGAHPSSAVCFGITMLLYTERGRVYDVATVEAWCREAGLATIEWQHAPDEGWTVVLASRPS